jgi:hypothetical protein
MFKLFKSRADVHLDRVSQLLREAQLARAEHQAAAEHHGALARMYSQRLVRLQAQLREAPPPAQGAAVKTDEQVPVEADPPDHHRTDATLVDLVAG